MPTLLSLRLFGAFEARVQGSPLPHLRTRRGEWLLALLALRAGQEVERGWLAATLWPQSQEAQAFTNLRESLHDVRRAAGPAADCLLSPTRRTLALDLTAAEVDVVAFDAAVAHGDLPSLAEAVALYRGALLEGCAEEWVFQERQAREQACLVARERLATLALERGDVTEAERHLRLAVATDPLRETAQRALMQLLAASGNFAAALLCYRELRLHLHRELNAGPDPETTALAQQLRAEARDKAGSLPACCPGAGSRSAGSGVVETAAPVRAARAPLPLPLTRVIGRERETAELTRLLDEHRLVTLTGPGGCGKTRLALHVATGLIDQFEAGAFFVSLAPIRDPSLVLSAIAQELGLRAGEPRSGAAGAGGRTVRASHAVEPASVGGVLPLERLKAALGAQPLLLLLDNFEQLLPAAPLIAELLASCPRLKVLVTSRAPLHLRGEKCFAVPPLAVPAVINPQLAVLTRYAAVQLFVERAADVHPEFALTHDNAPAVAEICRRLDGLPLAIELAAARIRLFTPEALLSRLQSPLNLLTGGPRDLPERQQTLGNTIRWSYDLLGTAAQKLFCRLSVFVGGATIPAAEAVCGGGGCWVVDLGLNVVDALTSLLDNHLLRQVPGADGELRLQMLETIREFAAQQLETSGEAEGMRRRHAEFFRRLAEQPPRRFDVELDNYRAALAWAVEKREAGTALRLGAALGDFWVDEALWAEGRAHLERALALPAAAGRTVERARALHAVSWLAKFIGDFPAARAFVQEGLAIARERGDRQTMARCQISAAHLALQEGGDGPEAAQRLLDEALTLARELGDQGLEAHGLSNLAGVAYRLSGREQAMELLVQSAEAYRAAGALNGTAEMLVHLAGHAQDQGEYRRAAEHLMNGLTAYRSVPTPFKANLHTAFVRLADLLEREGYRQSAARIRGAASRLADELGFGGSEAERRTAAIRPQMDAGVASTTWQEGQAMALHEAIDAAIREAERLCEGPGGATTTD